MSSLPIIDKFLQSVLSVSSGSNSTDALVIWFLRENTEFIWEGLRIQTFHLGDL